MTRATVVALAASLVIAGCSTGTSSTPSTSSAASAGPSASAPSSSSSTTTTTASSTDTSTATPTASPTSAADRSTRPQPGEATLLAVGDIARCDGRGDERTAAIAARLLKGSPSAPVLAMGDLAYPNGSARDFAQCYRPSWGRFDGRMRPALGNHEYNTTGAKAYFDYFGKAAGPRGKGWYSFDYAGWHVVALNSNCAAVGCGPTSAQVRWLAADLSKHRSRCTLAYWHHPRFSSGPHGSSRDVTTLWATLQKAGADVVLNGHDHDYERFAPQTADGRASARGIREFVVGTGGAESYPFISRLAHSQKQLTGVDAVLQLRLTRTGYRWALVGSAGAAKPLDAGSTSCS